MADYTMDRPIPNDRSQFRVAVVCALNEEFSAIAATLDIDFKRDHNRDFRQPETDKNTYKTGRIGIHDVVIVQLPSTGKEPAATAASSILGTYSEIKLALVVGVCAGAPEDQKGEDIILGDVLISTHVFQPDHARMFDTGMQPYQEVEDTLGRASKSIKGFLAMHSSDYEKSHMEDLVSDSVKTLLQKNFLQKYAYPGREKDKLFRPEYQHQHPKAAKCKECQKDPAECQEARETLCTILGCESAYLRDRKRLEPPTNIQPSDRQPLLPPSPLSSPLSPSPPPSPPQSPSPPPPPPCLHFGRFASADQLIRSSSHRDKLIKRYKVIGFEMEGAGVWDNIPTVVIKGVCDYADSHKNKGFQGYAAVTAAACAKVLLQNWHLVDELQVKERTLVNSTNQSLADREFETQLEDSRIAQEETDKLIEQLQQRGKKPARKQIETETKTEEEWEKREERAKIVEEAAAKAKIEEEKQKKIEESIILRESIRLDWIRLKMNRLEDEMRVQREANETEKAQRAARERPLPPPPTEALSPSQIPTPPWQPPKSDPEVDTIGKQPELFKTEQAKKEREEKQELEDGIRREAEDNFQRWMEEMRRAQEEANKEIKKAKAESERATRERIEAEKRAEEERQKPHDEAIKQAEREVRGKVELEENIRKEDLYHGRLEEMRRAQLEAERAARERPPPPPTETLSPPQIPARAFPWMQLMDLIINFLLLFLRNIDYEKGSKRADEKRQRPYDKAIKRAEREAGGKIEAERKAKSKPIVKSRL